MHMTLVMCGPEEFHCHKSRSLTVRAILNRIAFYSMCLKWKKSSFPDFVQLKVPCRVSA